ncbi:unnamed protein product [Lupinus luteus]|uniref:Expansin n=1 Tax=Lupinus luteus TaxID=3873 RepID=A0AAV1WHM4_LUPLU
MFTAIAIYKAGIIPVKYRHVPCTKIGGVKFELTGNPCWLQVLVYNVVDADDKKWALGKMNHIKEWRNQMDEFWSFKGCNMELEMINNICIIIYKYLNGSSLKKHKETNNLAYNIANDEITIMTKIFQRGSLKKHDIMIYYICHTYICMPFHVLFFSLSRSI